MPDRRGFIAGMAAAGLMPRASWADVGDPSFLSAGMKPDGSYVLCGLTSEGQMSFQLPLPGRGHAAAARPMRAEAVAFARRPGSFAIVLDCATGLETERLEAPSGHHFYGHGVFSAEGNLLFTTENDYDRARGVVGVWDAQRNYKRLGEFASGGVGPHDIKRMPDNSLIIANGGIETHPYTGRTKLNIPTMRPNLTQTSADGALVRQIELDPSCHKNSIRHLAVAANGTVAFAMQWQGDANEHPPLLGLLYQETDRPHLVQSAASDRMMGYLGSVAITDDATKVATTSPRSNVLQVFEHAALIAEYKHDDVCGVAVTRAGFFATTGTGLARSLTGRGTVHSIAWDNHVVSL